MVAAVSRLLLPAQRLPLLFGLVGECVLPAKIGDMYNASRASMLLVSFFKYHSIIQLVSSRAAICGDYSTF